MSEQQRNYNGTDEIDLISLAVNVQSTIYRYRILILIWFAVGLAAGITYYQLKPSIYESQMIVRSEILGESLLSVINENYEKLIKESNTTNIAKSLNMSTELAKELKSISIEATKSKEDKKATFFVITIESLSNSNWDVLQQSVISSLQQNPYVEKRIDLAKGRQENLINKIKIEIEEIEELKTSKKNRDAIGRDNVIVMDPSEIYSTLINLYKQQQSLEEELALNIAFEVIEVFDSFEQPVSPRPVMSAAVGSLIGLFITFMIIVGREFNKYLKKYKQS